MKSKIDLIAIDAIIQKHEGDKANWSVIDELKEFENMKTEGEELTEEELMEREFDAGYARWLEDTIAREDLNKAILGRKDV